GDPHVPGAADVGEPPRDVLDEALGATADGRRDADACLGVVLDVVDAAREDRLLSQRGGCYRRHQRGDRDQRGETVHVECSFRPTPPHLLDTFRASRAVVKQRTGALIRGSVLVFLGLRPRLALRDRTPPFLGVLARARVTPPGSDPRGRAARPRPRVWA